MVNRLDHEEHECEVSAVPLANATFHLAEAQANWMAAANEQLAVAAARCSTPWWRWKTRELLRKQALILNGRMLELAKAMGAAEAKRKTALDEYRIALRAQQGG
jgi:hypothetical protein